MRDVLTMWAGKKLIFFLQMAMASPLSSFGKGGGVEEDKIGKSEVTEDTLPCAVFGAD